MADNCYHNILENEGFKRIGSLNYDFQIVLWWHRQLHLELEIVQLHDWVLLRATKQYHLTAMGKDGELYTRDLAALDSYLTTHFEEVHISFSSIRDVTPNLIHNRIREISPRHLGDTILAQDQTSQNLEELSNEISINQSSIHQAKQLLKLNGGRSTLFPPPVYCTRTKRPFYPLELQRKCIEIRKTGIGHNGQLVIFYASRQSRSRKPQSQSDYEYEEVTYALKRMGLSVTCNKVKNAIKILYPSGLAQCSNEGTVIRDLFRYLKQ